MAYGISCCARADLLWWLPLRDRPLRCRESDLYVLLELPSDPRFSVELPWSLISAGGSQ
jgi:hypothetical protein